ncbi:MFS transporter [Streptomyces sp. NPDC127084]|uniref:MFS transporter n=1 Tax=Streptomyces sp. NPDC127084 TaxID=3347133 RepID=UPI00366A0E77
MTRIRLLPPAGPAARRLVLAQLVSSLGDGAFYTTSALYFSHVVGLSPARIGLGLTLAWAFGAVAGVPLGRLADRWGPRGTAVLLALATSASVGAFLVVRSFGPFLVAACCYAAAVSGLAAARQALLAGLVSKRERTAVLAHLQSRLNAGLALGAGVGGLALWSGSRGVYLAVFAMDAVSFAVCALVLARLPVVRGSGVPVAGDGGTAGGGPSRSVLRDRPYVVVTLLNSVLLLRMPLLSLGIPLWISERTEAPEWVASALFVLNTLGVAAFQVRAARGVHSTATAVAAVRWSGLVLFASCAVFALSGVALPVWAAVAVLAAGAVLHLAGEMRHSAGSWQISFDLAPAGRTGEYQGFFGTGLTLARTAGPLVLTVLLVGWGVPGWFLLGGLFVVASLGLGYTVRWAEPCGAVLPEEPRLNVARQRAGAGRGDPRGPRSA